MAQSQNSPHHVTEVTDIKSDTRGLVMTLILAGLMIVGFLAFVTYYGVIWTPGNPWEMMQ